MRKRRLPVISTALCVIFGILLVGNITIIAKGALQPDKAPSLFGYTPMIVLSGSMQTDRDDSIDVGDLVVTKRTDVQSLQKGDVIAYQNGTAIVTHRIVNVSSADGETVFQTQGDANNTPDDVKITPGMIVGRKVLTIPYLGRFAMFLQKPIGMLLFIALPVFLLALYDMLKRSTTAQRERQRRRKLEREVSRLREEAYHREKDGRNFKEEHRRNA